MELQLTRQREALKSLKESAAKKEAKLQERTREVVAAQAALDTQVQEAVRKLQEDQLTGASRSSTGRAKRAQRWCHLG